MLFNNYFSYSFYFEAKQSSKKFQFYESFNFQITKQIAFSEDKHDVKKINMLNIFLIFICKQNMYKITLFHFDCKYQTFENKLMPSN